MSRNLIYTLNFQDVNRIGLTPILRTHLVQLLPQPVHAAQQSMVLQAIPHIDLHVTSPRTRSAIILQEGRVIGKPNGKSG